MTLSPSEHNADQKLANVLYIDDSLADIELVKAILEIDNIRISLHCLSDGEEAISLLQTDDIFVKGLDVIFLDYNMPKCHGLTVLKFIKNHDGLQHIPVIMLTGSGAENDMELATSAGAEGYMIKPIDEHQLEKSVNDIPSLRFVRDGAEKSLYAV